MRPKALPKSIFEKKLLDFNLCSKLHLLELKYKVFYIV